MGSKDQITQAPYSLGAVKGMIPRISRIARSLGLHTRARNLAHKVGIGLPSGQDLQTRRNLTQLQAIEGNLNRNGYSLRNFSSVLDFACGSGRLIQYLSWLAPQARVFGCDVDADAIADARRQYPWATFDTNKIGPRLRYDDGQFDLIWSYSVFTSLSESNHIVWLKELARTLRPGGIMLHTTHSYENLRRLAMFCPELLKDYQLPEPVDQFIQAARGYYYVPYSPESPEFGLTIISKEYATAKWPVYSGLSLVDYVEGAIEGYPSGPQDFVILAKEPLKRHFG